MKDMSSGKGRLNVPGTQKELESNYSDMCHQSRGLTAAPEPITNHMGSALEGELCLVTGPFPHCCLGFMGTHSSVLCCYY